MLTQPTAFPTPASGTLIRQNLMSLAVVQDHVRNSRFLFCPGTSSNMVAEFALGRADFLTSPSIPDGAKASENVSTRQLTYR